MNHLHHHCHHFQRIGTATRHYNLVPTDSQLKVPRASGGTSQEKPRAIRLANMPTDSHQMMSESQWKNLSESQRKPGVSPELWIDSPVRKHANKCLHRWHLRGDACIE